MKLKGGQKLAFDVVLLGGSQAIAQLLNMVAIIYLARVLGDLRFGTVQMGVTVSSYALLAADFGLLALGMKELARLPQGDAVLTYVRKQLGILLPLSVVIFLLSWLALQPFEFYQQEKLLYNLYLLCVFAQLGMLEWASTGRQKPQYTGWFWLLRSGLNLLFLVLLFPLVESLAWIPAFYLMAWILAQLLMAPAFHRLLGGIPWPQFPTREESRARLSRAAPIGAGILVARLYLGADLLVLGALAGEAAAGQYSAAAKLVAVLFTATSVLWRVLLPRLSQLWVEGKEPFALAFSRAAGCGLGLLIPLAVGGALLAEPIIQLIYSEEYDRAPEALRRLAIAYPLISLGQFFGQGLVAQDRQRLYAASVSAGALALLLLLWWRIPADGVRGAADAVLVAGAIYLGLGALALRHSLKRDWWGSLLRGALAATAMGGALLFLEELHVVAQIGLGAAVYALLSIRWWLALLRRGPRPTP